MIMGTYRVVGERVSGLCLGWGWDWSVGVGVGKRELSPGGDWDLSGWAGG